MDTTLTKASAWLKQHTASERSFARVLRYFFGRQADRVARAAADVHGLTPAMVGLIFNADAEHAALMPLVRRNIAALMLSGAQSELRDLKPRKSIDPLDPDYGERFGLDAFDLVEQFIESIPAPVRDAIRHAVDEVTRQPYWRSIQDTVAANIGEIIKGGLDEGIAPSTMAARIREQLGGEDARRRAATIARTETTGALNAGHYAAIQSLDASDAVLGREWLAVGDDVTRETHQAAHGQKVEKGQPFSVGGYEARYPGDVLLPAQERIRCRCTTVAVIDA